MLCVESWLFLQHCAGINCLALLAPAVSDGSDYLFTGSRDGRLKRWALAEDAATCSATFESHVDWVILLCIFYLPSICLVKFILIRQQYFLTTITWCSYICNGPSGFDAFPCIQYFCGTHVRLLLIHSFRISLFPISTINRCLTNIFFCITI